MHLIDVPSFGGKTSTVGGVTGQRAAVALPRPRHRSIPSLDAAEAADRMVGGSYGGGMPSWRK